MAGGTHKSIIYATMNYSVESIAKFANKMFGNENIAIVSRCSQENVQVSTCSTDFILIFSHQDD